MRLQQARKILTHASENAAGVMRRYGLLRGSDIHIRQRGRDDAAIQLAPGGLAMLNSPFTKSRMRDSFVTE
jgi:hypothetical protein